ncbi:hypothetical protein ACS0TY_003459 [Phlomoides rotata]
MEGRSVAYRLQRKGGSMVVLWERGGMKIGVVAWSLISFRVALLDPKRGLLVSAMCNSRCCIVEFVILIFTWSRMSGVPLTIQLYLGMILSFPLPSLRNCC